MRVVEFAVPITGTGVADYTIDIRATVPVEVSVQPTAGDIDRGIADDTSTINSLDDSEKDWAVNIWEGSYVRIIDGTGVGQARRIASNTASSIVPVNAFSTAPDSTSVYLVYPGGAGNRDIDEYTATGAGAINVTTAVAGAFRFLNASVKFDILPTTPEDVTLTLDSGQGAVYDAVVSRVDPSAGAGTGDAFFTGGEGHDYESADQLVLAYTNTDGRTYGARIVVELL